MIGDSAVKPFAFDPNEIINYKLNKEQLSKYNGYDETEIMDVPGQHHYRLLSFLAHKYNNSTIIDIGTDKGFSSIALASNKTNNVMSFDIKDNIDPRIKADFSNIYFVVANIFTNLAIYGPMLLKAPFIVLDVDPHEGVQEYKLYQYLLENNYQGFIIADDIWHFQNMRNNFWYLIPYAYKLDITDVGHWSGTGLIRFNRSPPPVEDIGRAEKIVPFRDNWTFVTAYFDLTKCPDASKSIKARPAEHYLLYSRSTLALNVNMVIYTDEVNIEAIKAYRPAFLEHRTKYILCDFEELPLTKYRNKIIQNRKEHPYMFDDRNTASYYLLCMARYALLKRTIEENPFGSIQFGWVNFCLERMGINNIKYFDEVICAMREKFSTCYMDYIDKSLIDNVQLYYQFGRCSMCSGFFTGSKYYMKRFCDLIEEKFMYYLELGYGHADEQLFSPVYFDHPEIFEFYYGDYTSMVSNYDIARDNLLAVIDVFINHTLKAEKYNLAAEACSKIWKYCDKYNNGTKVLMQCRNRFLEKCIVAFTRSGNGNMAIRSLLEKECCAAGH